MWGARRGILATMVAHWVLAVANAQQLKLAANELVNEPGVTVEGGSAAEAYKRATLSPAANADFKVDVFLPPSNPDEKVYYNGTRFDWSTLIGNVKVGDLTIFPVDFWAGTPHDSENPEAGVGLAAEFGCGELDWGHLCPVGKLNHPTDSLNGVLGWEEAAMGEAFLKIGVGKLVKQNSSQDDRYNFFTRYQFVEYPDWDVTIDEDTVTMSSEASLGDPANVTWGYRLTTQIKVGDGTIRQTTTIENTGFSAFATPHYSHNFLAVDSMDIGPPWKVSLVPNMTDKEEPTQWSTPMAGYVTNPSLDTLEVIKEVEEGASLKAYYTGESNKDAADAWTATWGQLKITSTQQNTDPKLYMSNIFISRTTFSPEPTQYIDLAPGANSTWTREIRFELEPTTTMTATATATATAAPGGSNMVLWVAIGVGVVIVAVGLGVALLFLCGSNPDEEGQQGGGDVELTEAGNEG